MEWIKVVSWHAIKTWTRVPGRAITLCGLTSEGETSADLPSEKSCETCLRIVARRADGG